MALAEVGPNVAAEAGQAFSERYYEDLELMQAREVNMRTLSPEMLDRILPFYSPADALVERQLVVHDLDRIIVSGLTTTALWGWDTILRESRPSR